MKSIGLSIVMAGLLLAGCRKPVVQTDDNSTPQPAATTQAPAPAALSSAPSRELAPSGVFYLLAPVRKDTKEGIVRLLPGTEVRLSKNGKYITPEGEMALDPRILTNDMAVARGARRADALAQATNRSQGLPATSTSAAPSVPAASPSAATAPIAWTPMGATPAPQADEASVRTMKFRLSVLKGDEAKLQANLDYLVGKTPSAPAGLSGTTSPSDWNLLVQKLNAVQQEIQTLEAKLGPAAN